MNEQLGRLLVTVAFGMHGLGMVGGGVSLPWGMTRESTDFVGASWLLGSGTAAIAIGVLLWVVAGGGYIAAAAGVWQGAEWWRQIAWVGAVGTVVALGLWFGEVPYGAYVGGLMSVGLIGYLIVR